MRTVDLDKNNPIKVVVETKQECVATKVYLDKNGGEIWTQLSVTDEETLLEVDYQECDKQFNVKVKGKTTVDVVDILSLDLDDAVAYLEELRDKNRIKK